tara:strand:+ start:182 stop:598 length:417 start_codon:yes stop_codon:yes gene_type:complete
MTPGYRTSSFWFTLVSFIFSGLFLMGVIKDVDQKEELISVVTHAVESIILIATQGFILYKYMKSRSEEKVELEKAKQPQAPTIIIEEPYDTKQPRLDPSRNRKANIRGKRIAKRSKTLRGIRSVENTTTSDSVSNSDN